MSTELKTLKGKIQISQHGDMTSKYKSIELHLNKFWGGKECGTSLQLGITDEEGEYSYIQLDNQTVKELISILTESF